MTRNLGRIIPRGGHFIRWEWDRDVVVASVDCDEPPDADCRLTSGCDCEEWTVERDEGGAFHAVGDPDLGTAVVHRMTPGQGCNVVEWLENTGVMDAAVPGQTVLLGVIRVTPVWEPGAGYAWRADR